VPSFDDLLQLVLDKYKAVDVSKLPPPVQSAFVTARAKADQAAHDVGSFLGIDPASAQAAAAVIGAAAPAVVNLAGSILHGDSQAALQAFELGAVAITTAINPALGAAVAAAEQILNVIMQNLGAKGGGTTYCVGWYGAFNVGAGEQPPYGPQDAAWIPWTNKTPRAADCSDDTPTLAGRGVIYQIDDTHAWSGVSGQFSWLEDVVANHPSDFDVTLAQALGVLLEKYINARGPAPKRDPQCPWPQIDFGEAAYAFLAGWNATHLGPSIQIDPSRLPQTPVTSNWAGKTTTQMVTDWGAVARMPGAVLYHVIATGHVLNLNTGPLDPALAGVFYEAPTPQQLTFAARQGGSAVPSGRTFVLHAPLTHPAAATDAATGAPVPTIAVVYPYVFTAGQWQPVAATWGDLSSVYHAVQANPGAFVGYYSWDGQSMTWHEAA
jgi:hypothetical protein